MPPAQLALAKVTHGTWPPQPGSAAGARLTLLLGSPRCPAIVPRPVVKGGRRSWRPSSITVGWRDVLMVACGAEGKQEWLSDKWA